MSSSSVATYCDPQESVCQNCKDTVCMGSDGCVCMTMCQVSSWEAHVLEVDGCISSSASGSNGMTTSAIANTLPVILAIGLAGFVLFGGTILAIKRLPRATAQGGQMLLLELKLWYAQTHVFAYYNSLKTTENTSSSARDAHRSSVSSQRLARRPWEARERQSNPDPGLGLPSNRRRGANHTCDRVASHSAVKVALTSREARRLLALY